MMLASWFSIPWLSGSAAILLDVAAKATILCGLALIVTACAGRKRPLVRSAALNACMAALLVLPLVAITFPKLRLPILPADLGALEPPAASPAAFPAAGERERDLLEAAPALARSELLDAAPRGEAPLLEPIPEPPESETAFLSPAGAIGPSIIPAYDLSRPTVEPRGRIDWTSWAAACYAAVTAFLTARFIGAFVALSALRSSAREVNSRRWRRALSLWKRRLRVRRPVLLAASDRVSVPLTLGWFAPAIILPEGFAGRHHRLHRDSVLVHELAHVRRADFVWHILGRAVKALYWFHPLVWLAERLQESVREEACDDHCVYALRSARRYQRVLLDVAGGLAGRPAGALGLAMARSSKLARRIRRLAGGTSSPECVPPRSVRIGLVSLLIGAAAGAGTLELARREAAGAEPAPAAAASMEVRVVHAETGKPIADAALALRIDQKELHGTTDGRGRASFALPEPAVKYASLSVEKASHVPLRMSWQSTGSPVKIPPAHTFELEDAVPGGGFVRDARGEAVAGAIVYLTLEGEGQGGTIDVRALPLATDERGRWSARVLPALRGRVEAVRFNTVHPLFRREREPQAGEPSFREAFRRSEAVIVLERGLEISGRVVGSAGEPIAGAKVVRVGMYGHYDGRSPAAVTREEGSFRLGGFEEGGAFIAVEATGFSPLQRQVFPAPELEPLELRLERSRTVRFRVVDERARPLEGATVHITAWGSLQPWDWRFRTDSAGTFEWDSAPVEPVSVKAYRSGRTRSGVKMLLPGETELALVLPPELRVHGDVVDAETGAPVASFRVVPGYDFGPGRISWSHEGARLSSGGRFTASFDYPRHLTYIRIEAEGYLPAVSRSFRSDEGEVEADFRLRRAGSIEGRVLLPDGTPAAEAMATFSSAEERLHIENGHARDARERLHDVTGSDGRFSLPDLPGPRAIVVLHDAGYAVVHDGAAGDLRGVRLTPWGRIEGRLVAGAEPVPSASVRAAFYTPPGDSRDWVSFRYSAITDAAGAFTFERVQAGEARVGRELRTGKSGEMGGNDNFGENEYVEVEPGGTARVTVGAGGVAVTGKLAAPAGLEEPPDWERARVRITRRVPLPRQRPDDAGQAPEWYEWYTEWWPSAEAKAHRRAEWSATARVAADGTFRARSVPAGSYVLSCSLGGPPAPHPGLGFPVAGRTLAQGSHTFDVPGEAGKMVDLGDVALETKRYLDPGDAAPPLVAEGLDGAEFRLEALRGKYVLLDFWATWCGPCIRELPNLEALHESIRDDSRIVLVGVSIDDDLDALRAFLKKRPLAWRQAVLRDPERRKTTLDAYQITGVPATVLVGPDGKVVASRLGGSGLTDRVRRLMALQTAR